jgi:cytochrome d ubiquinol oxidase subunit II
MLAGLIFRGVAFEFRFKAKTSKHLWSWSFCVGSIVASFAQGAVVGAYIQGFETEGFAYSGGALDWLTPFTVFTGLGLVAGYALLGSTWLILKTEGEVQEFAYNITPKLLAGLMAVFAIVSIYTPFVDTSVQERWFSGPSLIWALPVMALFCAFVVFNSVRKRDEGMPFVATMGIFLFSYLGLLASKWPYIVPPKFTIYDAASAYNSQLFLLLGFLFVIPIVLAYTSWTYWVFRGKVKEGGYH